MAKLPTNTNAPQPGMDIPNNVDTGGELGAAGRADEASQNATPRRVHRARITLADMHKTYAKGKGKRKW